ncbi:MAG: 4-hydroxybenzoate octaprenyltransferase [Alphaproteobacteria bacterium]|nr:4-hydroxybenzoate octaprenyltransferase [Alphaproteobacteria bacterium]
MSATAAQAQPAPGWIRHAPAWARPYLRLARVDKPVGIWLLLWPCWWSLLLAGGNPWLFTLFGAGAVVMRAAGCVINDIIDRDLDAAVARTATRPLASGELRLSRALAFLMVLLAAGLAVLLQLPREGIALGAASLPLVALYPLMKRITWWPQVFLGLAFNWGALLAWVSVRGTLELPALILYGAGIAWTLGYDTIYAHQDKADDERAGIKSSARRLGRATRPWLAGFYGVAVAGFAAAALAAGHGWAILGLLLPAAAHVAWQTAAVELDRPEDCLAKFRANVGFGWLVAAAFTLARYVG